jgi:hypothetical protein
MDHDDVIESLHRLRGQGLVELVEADGKQGWRLTPAGHARVLELRADAGDSWPTEDASTYIHDLGEDTAVVARRYREYDHAVEGFNHLRGSAAWKDYITVLHPEQPVVYIMSDRERLEGLEPMMFHADLDPDLPVASAPHAVSVLEVVWLREQLKDRLVTEKEKLADLVGQSDEARHVGHSYKSNVTVADLLRWGLDPDPAYGVRVLVPRWDTKLDDRGAPQMADYPRRVLERMLLDLPMRMVDTRELRRMLRSIEAHGLPTLPPEVVAGMDEHGHHLIVIRHFGWDPIAHVQTDVYIKEPGTVDRENVKDPYLCALPLDVYDLPACARTGEYEVASVEPRFSIPLRSSTRYSAPQTVELKA